MYRNVIFCQVGLGGGREEEQILSFTSSSASNQGWKMLVHFPKEYPEVYFPNMHPLFAIVFFGISEYTPVICDYLGFQVSSNIRPIFAIVFRLHVRVCS